MRITLKRNTISALAIAVATLSATAASATEGYFQHGYGARHKALGGAGVADTRDATAISINPAGLVNAGHSFVGALSFFAPDRGFTGSGGPGFTPSGAVEGNETSIFFVPNIAYSRPVGENGAFGISMIGNGGMNSDYAAVANPACMNPMMPTPAPNGVFCGGEAGVNLVQAFIYVGYAHDFGNFSIGISPVLAIQGFEAKGLALFGAFSADGTKITNNETDFATGGGIRVGIEADVSENFRVGASYQSKLSMGKFDDYAGLFANGGEFDIPQNYQVGAALDVSESLTIMADYRWINYESVSSIANSSRTPAPLGSSGGPGFGWKDISVFKIGAEWDCECGTYRIGYAHNDNPITGDDVTFNILAPGVVTTHYTAGFERKMTENGSLEVAIMYAPEENVSGIEVTPLGPNPGHTIELGMKQWDVTVGWKHNFGQ